jgi:hypothetical protein
MRKIVMMILIGMISIGFIACTPQPNPEKEEVKNIAKDKRIIESKLASLRDEHELIGTGVAGLIKRQNNSGYDLALQRDEAIASAKKHIAGQIQTKVDALLDNLSKAKNQGSTRSIKNRIHNIINQKVQGAKIKLEWMSESSGDLYVFMAVDRKKTAKKVTDSIKETLKDEGIYPTDEKMENLSKEILSI